jgi:hypothetical protein
LRGKRKKPVKYQDTGEPEPEQPSKKARPNESKKRKRKDEKRLDLEPPDKRRSPPAPRTTVSGMGATCRTEREKHTGREQHSSLNDRVVKQRRSTADKDNYKNVTALSETTAIKSSDTEVNDV